MERVRDPETGKMMNWRKVRNTVICLGLTSELVAMSFGPMDMDVEPIPDACLPTTHHELQHEPPPNYYVPEFVNSMQVVASGPISISNTLVDYPSFSR